MGIGGFYGLEFSENYRKMKINIRKAVPKDFDRIEEILKQDDMLSYPKIDGKEAMYRIHKKMGNYFLIAEENKEVVGLVRGCYDGSRALIHELAIDKKYQKQGIGKKLISELALRFKKDGAPSVSVTANKNSIEYYEKLGFSNIEISLMVAFDINKVIQSKK